MSPRYIVKKKLKKHAYKCGLHTDQHTGEANKKIVIPCFKNQRSFIFTFSLYYNNVARLDVQGLDADSIIFIM